MIQILVFYKMDHKNLLSPNKSLNDEMFEVLVLILDRW